jgi:hypothetical protein
MPEGLSAAEVGKEIAEHREHAGHGTQGHSRHERLISIAEAALLSAVALLAAWSGYSAAKWGSESSLSPAEASATRTQENRFDIEANADPHAGRREVQQRVRGVRDGQQEALRPRGEPISPGLPAQRSTRGSPPTR